MTLPEDYQGALAPDWPWQTIRAAIMQRGLTLDALAVRAGYAAATGRCVKREPLPRLQAEIARLLGYAPMAIWPTRYDAHGQPLTKRQWLARMETAAANQDVVMPVRVP